MLLSSLRKESYMNSIPDSVTWAFFRLLVCLMHTAANNSLVLIIELQKLRNSANPGVLQLDMQGKYMYSSLSFLR
jgi:hypothetical protein